MLADLPPEIIQLIACYLPSASALVNLSRTCHRLHEILAAENWRIFRAFVRTKFPGVVTPEIWREAAQALTSRSRALDKHAVIARFVVPASEAVKVGSHQSLRGDNPTHGYRPALDSYEVWNSSAWNDRKEVLAWGAADEVVLRITEPGAGQKGKWVVFNDLDHISSHDDICGVHLLRPEHHAKEPDKEHIIFARVRGELFHLSIDPDAASHVYKQQFMTTGLGIERTDLSYGTDPILSAHLSTGSILFYSTTSEEEKVQPFARLNTDSSATDGNAVRNKYSKFLSPSLFAVSTGRIHDAIAISTITPERQSLERELSVELVDFERLNLHTPIKSNVNAIAPLDPTGQVFLAAWGDRAVRLHDLRSDKDYEKVYHDTTDQNPIYCVHPFGHDRFIVGAGGDALVKIFDLRMPKQETYSYHDARPSPTPTNYNKPLTTSLSTLSLTNPSLITSPRKDISIFLSAHPPTNRTRPRNQSTRSYRGAIYSMTSPSPSSPTIYTGVADGVVRLDFTSTDDLHGPCKSWYRDPLSIDLNTHSRTKRADRILELSGYERPENTTASITLRTQQTFRSVGEDDVLGEEVTGWDRRWQRLEKPGAWRRED
ncbi:F-box domain protein [Aspergillus ibericus CBS 121593]|uniref:F-box domain protein n=1 Tax=Aspergillus ibericus CBS 121593 TaxID=1448316 RepID=A0A395GXY9_9EURO|nr:F-box domain protein [Aspergillus ibericus CBS 121593]RAL00406.1 F-box domain protein [Aspergillus ibericus CBS 121593]